MKIVKFKNPYPDENPNALYVVLEEIGEDTDRPRAIITPLISTMVLKPQQLVLIKDLEEIPISKTYNKS